MLRRHRIRAGFLISSIAAFLRLPRAHVSGGEPLGAGGTRLDYDWSGYAAMDVLSYLQEKGPGRCGPGPLR